MNRASALSCGLSSATTAIDWKPQFDTLDALQQLGCARGLILLDLRMPVTNGYQFLGR
jgi:CheY-like chemotaxis protein